VLAKRGIPITLSVPVPNRIYVINFYINLQLYAKGRQMVIFNTFQSPWGTSKGRPPLGEKALKEKLVTKLSKAWRGWIDSGSRFFAF
jgi:hypothetical protein